jgi:acyl carrier protein phosphodiesterase
MNWLAHLRLAPNEPLLRLGNLAGDFVRGTDVAALHPELQRGVRMHRAIDRFVDAHPVAVRARQRLQPPSPRQPWRARGQNAHPIQYGTKLQGA